jgi:hypothetical protein
VALGCYSYTPLDTSGGIPVGERVAVEITDRGRAELSDRIGTAVMRIEGTVTRTDAQDMEMNVWRVAQMGGETARWNGELVKFRKDFVASMHSRSLNKGRTWLVTGAAAVGLIYFMTSTELFGSYYGGEDPPGPPPGQSSRGWWF